MNEQMIHNMAEILLSSLIQERRVGGDESIIIMHFRPALLWAFGATAWDDVEERFRELVMEHDAKDEIDATH